MGNWNDLVVHHCRPLSPLCSWTFCSWVATLKTSLRAKGFPSLNNIANKAKQSKAEAPHRSLGPPGEVNKVSHPDLQEHSASWVGYIKSKSTSADDGRAAVS